jgi:hypothetical protein
MVLARAPWIPKCGITQAIPPRLSAAENVDLKYRIQAELISRRDLSELSPVVDLLLSDSLSGEQRQSFLLIVINDVKNPKALAMIRRLSRSRNPLTRRAAAEALWHIGDTDDISDLGGNPARLR